MLVCIWSILGHLSPSHVAGVVLKNFRGEEAGAVPGGIWVGQLGAQVPTEVSCPPPLALQGLRRSMLAGRCGHSSRMAMVKLTLKPARF